MKTHFFSSFLIKRLEFNSHIQCIICYVTGFDKNKDLSL